MRPTNRHIRIAAALTIAAGLVACGVAIFSEELGLGAEVARGTFGWKRISLLVTGVAIVVAGALLLARPEWGSRPENWERIEHYLQHSSGRHLRYLAVGLIGLLGLVLVWTRLISIGDSLWHDEAFTILNYSRVGPGAILLGQSDFGFAINNHVAYNLLSWLTVSVVGESEAMYRVWSVVPAIAAIAAATWWAWRRLGPIAAVAFAALAVAAPQHFELAPQARGYGLVLLAATLMLIAADHLTRAYSRWTLIGFMGAGLLGVWTLTIFAIAFVGQALALLRWPNLWRPVIAAMVAAGALSLLFYAPVLGQLIQDTHPSGETIPLGSALLLERSLGWLAVPSFTLPLAAQPARWMTFAGLALIVLAIARLWRRGETGLALNLAVPPLFFNVVFSLGGLTTVSRHQFLLLTHVVLLVAVGIAELGRIVVARVPRLTPVAVTAGVVAVLALSSAIVDRERTTLPFEDMKAAASIAHQAEIGPVVTDSIRPHGLRYYLGGDLIELPPRTIEALLCERRRELVYVRHIAVPPLTADYRAPARLNCLRGEDAVRVRVPQRSRGRAIDVWIINPPSVTRKVIRDDIENAPGPWIEKVWGVDR